MPVTKVKPEDWVDAGIKLFSDGGVKAISIEKMAKMLNCTKGSFYWYFKSREGFLAKMLEYWVLTIGTESYFKETKNYNSPAEKFRAIMRHLFKRRDDKDTMFYLRHYAQQNDKVKIFVDMVEQRRIDYLEDLLQDMGLDPESARARAEVLYHYYIGWYERHKFDETNKQEIERQIDVLERLVQQENASEPEPG